jgi:hypothetical protein
MHPAAIADRARGEQLGANVLIMASTAAAAWLAGNPRFADRTGERRRASSEKYLRAYHGALQESA